MAEPNRKRRHSSTGVVIAIAPDGSCPMTHVKPGVQVQWTAPAGTDAWVQPPLALSGSCRNRITIPAGQTKPDKPCVVTGRPGPYHYSSGVENGPRHPLDNDTIIVDTTSNPR
jgi:hypothetical protein